MWITSLLFDLNYKLLMGASLLAVAKSIYYQLRDENIIASFEQQQSLLLLLISIL